MRIEYVALCLCVVYEFICLDFQYLFRCNKCVLVKKVILSRKQNHEGSEAFETINHACDE